ncbi:hypothetical protein GWI72_08245 [Microvirga tunisiensis]|uniref:Secreted protein n=1 Tax=Pannonibacter tanglangensis TaxID=2750084 RepID=A0A7X5F225_9HYPH|nr:hypothetical protein [Pannonibacter sp. XCT-53]NBN78253.1 hypothetical protein [Pannonibacter sp. XCT-53]
MCVARRLAPLLLASGAGLLVAAVNHPAAAGPLQGQRDCAAEARAFADRVVGDRDALTKLLEGGITGAVAGGAWLGSANGIDKGARTGAAKAYSGSMAQDPRVWQALYDTALQTCAAGGPSAASGASVSAGGGAAGTGATGTGAGAQGCRSRAGVVGSSGGGSTLSAGSGATGCR